MPNLAALAALSALLVLGGCGLFGGDDEEEQAAVQQQPAALYESVVEVEDIEIGRTRDGLVITAIGLAPGVGYASPDLRPRRDGQPGPDGYLDFDFVARAPLTPVAGGQNATRARLIRADHLIAIRDLRGARGIRIHAAEGGMLMNF